METFETLTDMFETSAKRFAHRPLFGVKRQGRYLWMTYGEVSEQVDACRSGLSRLGVREGDRVAIISDNRPEWAVVAYATYGLGAQLVPMYEAQQPGEWEFILRDCGAKLLIVADEKLASKCRSILQVQNLPLAVEHVVVVSARAEDPASYSHLLDLGRAHPVPSVATSPRDVCGFIYTSGTTGEPKGVLLTHRNVTSNINALRELFPIGSDDVSLSFLPWAHSFGQTCELHCMVSYGAAIGIAESVSTVFDNLAEVRPTVLFSVPRTFHRVRDTVLKTMKHASGLNRTLFHSLRDVSREKRRQTASGRTSFTTNLKMSLLDKFVATKLRERFGGRLKYAFSGGAALSPEVGEFIDDLGLPIYEGYGLTETSPVAITNSPRGRKLGSVGRPLPGVTVKLHPVEIAAEGEGEIVIYGPNVMQGYHNRPDDNALAFTADGGFRTGDIGRIDSDGFVFVTGRIKELFKLENGKYVAPSPLEDRLRLSPFIADIVVDGANRPYSVAVIVPDFEALESWAKNAGITFGAREDLTGHPEVHRLVSTEIETLGASFKSFERPEKFILVTEDFTPSNDLLTPSHKVKRRHVISRYGAQLDKLYRT
jgi:long-chain acyl-CoA synthetase